MLTGAAGFDDDDDDREEFEFSGVIQSLPPSGLIGDWVVGGRTVHVTSSTRIEMEDGLIAVGAFVEVEGRLLVDGSVDAREIETEEQEEDDDDDDDEFEFRGVIQSLPPSGLIGDWVVGGRTVHVTSSTRIEMEDGLIAVGALVEVKGRLLVDGSVDARKIETEEQDDDDDDDDEFKFRGVIQSLPPSGLIGDWVVGGRTVHVTSSTRIKMEHGVIALGALVEVKGRLLEDGTVDARKIEVEAGTGGGGKSKFQGFIDQLPSGGLVGDWVVSGQTVHVSSNTRIKAKKATITVGALVSVKGARLADGSTSATKIKLK
jgi:hypothetical protein